MGTAHNQLVSTILEYLTLKGILVFRMNTGAYAVEDGNHARRFIRFGVPGMSDILGTFPPEGRTLACECKIPPDKPTLAQRAFLAAVEAYGGIAIVARSLDDVMALFEERTEWASASKFCIREHRNVAAPFAANPDKLQSPTF